MTMTFDLFTLLESVLSLEALFGFAWYGAPKKLATILFSAEICGAENTALGPVFLNQTSARYD